MQSSTACSVVALQYEGPEFEPQPWVILCEICMFSCIHGYSLGTPASSHILKR